MKVLQWLIVLQGREQMIHCNQYRVVLFNDCVGQETCGPLPPFHPQCSSKCAWELFIAALRKSLKHSSHQCMMVCVLEMGPSTPHLVCACLLQLVEATQLRWQLQAKNSRPALIHRTNRIIAAFAHHNTTQNMLTVVLFVSDTMLIFITI